ncbi:hypothetical protein AAFC00_003063 [Neodothiora populina]|uniref:Conidiation-specific protein 6 n=1 Tax=Neodothiora populina TaxID=2781224 RepID=A0ABR3P955_9PEZI
MSAPNPDNVAAGHKANIHNPNTSKESKEHSEQVLEAQFHTTGDGKDYSHVVGGLKAATHNPNVREEAKEHAQERLEELK